MTYPPSGIPVGLRHQLFDGVRAIADDLSGDPFGEGRHGSPDDQNPVVLARDEVLHDDAAAPGFCPGEGESLADRSRGPDPQAHPPSVVAVGRLHRHRITEPVRRPDRLLLGMHLVTAGHGETGVGQKFGSEPLVAGYVDSQPGGLGGDGGANPLLMDPLAQLDQGMLVETQIGDVPGGCLVEDRLSGGSEGHSVRCVDQLLDTFAEVQGDLVGGHQMVDDVHREVAGLEGNFLVAIAVDHVVPATDPRPPGLPPVYGGTGVALQLQSDVLGDMAGPGAVTETLHESSGRLAGTGVVFEAGE